MMAILSFRFFFMNGPPTNDEARMTKENLFSRRQSLDQPTAVALESVTKAIMQAIRTPLPEFNQVGFNPVPAPVRRQWNALVTKAFRHFGHARFQHTTSVKDLALTRRPGAQ